MKKKLAILIVAEILVMVLAIYASVNHFHKNEITVSYGQDDFHCLAGDSDNGFYVEAGMENFKEIQIGLPKAELPRGSYVVDVEYQSEGIAHLAVSYSHGRGNWDLSGKVMLSDGESHKKFGITVEDGGEPFFIAGRLNSECLQGDYLLLQGITISRSFEWYRVRLFGLLMLLLVLDTGICLYYLRGKINFTAEKKKTLTAVCMIAFIASIPLLADYIYMQQDTIFHLNRIEGIKEGLQAGNFPVRIQPQWLNGHGYPVSVFYGDFWLYIPALLSLAGVAIQTCYMVFIALTNIATAGISYICFRKMSGSRKVGLAATALYTLNVYRLTNIYVRSAVGEFTAMIFFPIILFGLWYIFTNSPETVKKGRIWALLSFGYIGVLFSHLISCEMVGLFTILACILQIKKVFVKERFLELSKALLGLVIAGAWFWIPLLEYIQLDFVSSDMNRFSIHRQQERGMFWAQFFSTRYDVNGGSLASSMGMTGEMPLTLGIAFLLILLATVYICVCSWKGIRNKKEWVIGVGLTALSVWICTIDFPFRWIGEKFEFTKLLLNSLQFPWRFLAIVVLLCVWVFVMIMANMDFKEKEKGIFAVVVCAMLLVNGMDLMSEVMNASEVARVYDGRILSSLWVQGGEYMYSGFDMEDYVNEITDIEEGIDVIEWKKGSNEVELYVSNNSGEERTLELPVIFYKGYRGKDIRTGEELMISNGKSHRVKLHLPGGYSGNIKVEFSEPWYWRAAELVSLTGFILAVAFFIREKYRLEKGTKLFLNG